MRVLSGSWIFAVLTLCLLGLTLQPARAGSTLVPADSPSSLAIPGSAVPTGYTVDGMQSHAITNQLMLSTLGQHASKLFQQEGWVTGYHGWLNANDLTYQAFITYDFYGFKTAIGAQAAASLYLGLALGVQTPTSNGALPPDAQVFVDSTGDYSTNLNDLQPFVAVEVVFRIQNVLADVTGYYRGGDSQTIDDATTGSISAATTISTWLSERARTVHGSELPLLLLAFAIFPCVPGRRRT